MGLDIVAASHLRYVRPMPEFDELDRMELELSKEGKYIGDHYFLLHPNDEGHEPQLAGMEPGLYEYTPATEQHEFRAGSYTSYNHWRAMLSRSALGTEPEGVWENPDKYAGRPFVELINFTDCDGRIGTAVAAKLAADFRAHAAAAEEHAAELPEEDRGYFRDIYDEFTKAFEVAAQDGALRFC